MIPLGNLWHRVSLPTVSGGVLYADGTYYYRAFTSSGSLAVSNMAVSVDIVSVGGGGGTSYYGAGGGAAATSTSYSMLGTYSIAVGAAGSGGSPGGISGISGIISANGGGGSTGWDGGTSGTGYVGGGGSSYFGYSSWYGAYTQGMAGGGGGGAASNGTSGVVYWTYGGGSTLTAQGGNGGNPTTVAWLSTALSIMGYGSPNSVGMGGGGFTGMNYYVPVDQYGGSTPGGAPFGRGNGAGLSATGGLVIVRYLRSAVGG